MKDLKSFQIAYPIFVVEQDGQSKRPGVKCLTWGEAVLKCGFFLWLYHLIQHCCCELSTKSNKVYSTTTEIICVYGRKATFRMGMIMKVLNNTPPLLISGICSSLTKSNNYSCFLNFVCKVVCHLPLFFNLHCLAPSTKWCLNNNILYFLWSKTPWLFHPICI